MDIYTVCGLIKLNLQIFMHHSGSVTKDDYTLYRNKHLKT